MLEKSVRDRRRYSKAFFQLILISIFTFILFAGGVDRVFADEVQKEEKITSATIKGWFSYENLTGSLLAMPYRKAIIHGEQPGLPALVICLHGKSASGIDNEKQMKNMAVRSSALYFYNLNQKAVILAPQCPKGNSWYKTNMLTTLRELITLFQPYVNTKRIYILGESAGGYGTWAMTSAYPQLFAAAFPVAATVRGDVNQIQYTPICTVVGEKDKSAPEAKVRPVVQQLQALGAQVHFQVIPKANHSACCSQAFSDENLSWVFSHTLGVIKAPNPLDVEGKTVKVKYKRIKKKKKIIGRRKVIKYIKRGKGTMTFIKVKGNKKITIDRHTGKVTIKKGLKKGSYKVKAEVLAAGDGGHIASPTKKVTFKIKVK